MDGLGRSGGIGLSIDALGSLAGLPRLSISWR